MNTYCGIIPHLRLIVVTTQIAASYLADRLRTIYEKLHVTNRTQAALYALRQGWATLDKPPGQALPGYLPRSSLLATPITNYKLL